MPDGGNRLMPDAATLVECQSAQPIAHDETKVADSQHLRQGDQGGELVQALLAALNLAKPLLGTPTQLRARAQTEPASQPERADTLTDALVNLALILIVDRHGVTSGRGHKVRLKSQ
jgi:hypothetical protein